MGDFLYICFMEIWKDIVGYEGLYKISNFGKIYSLHSDRHLTLSVSDDGYPQINLCSNGDQKLCRVHILVAKHFLSNPSEYQIVNHKDRNRNNCYVDNLEWVSRVDNNLNRLKNNQYPSRDRIHYSEEEIKDEVWVNATQIIDELKDKDFFMVSNLGRIRYIKSNGSSSKEMTVSVKKTHSDKKYPRTSVRVQDKKQDFYIHLLVTKCFLGPTPNGMIVDHIDSNRNNPRVSNLQFLTLKENSLKGDNKNQPKGHMNVCSKLNKEQVFMIYNLYFHKSKTVKEIKELFNVSIATIRNIVKIKSYTDCYTLWLNK
jgi:hypothetical protein